MQWKTCFTTWAVKIWNSQPNKIWFAQILALSISKNVIKSCFGHFTFTLFYLHYTEAIMLNLDIEFEAVLISFVMNSWFHLILHCKEQDQSHLLTILPENFEIFRNNDYISWINEKNTIVINIKQKSIKIKKMIWWFWYLSIVPMQG